MPRIYTVVYNIGRHYRFGFCQASFSGKMGGGGVQWWCWRAGRGLVCGQGKGAVLVDQKECVREKLKDNCDGVVP